MAKIVPLISSGEAGPLGVLHLPRLWLKTSLDATGQLADDYPAVGAGFDSMVLNGLGLDKDEFLAYIKDSKPTYCDLEKWILDKKGGSLDAAAVKELNDSISGYIHDDGTRASICSESGISDDGSIKDAVNLNNIDDWYCFHQATLS